MDNVMIAPVEFKLLSSSEELTQAIRWNLEEVKAYVTQVNNAFTGIQYTEEEEKECKKDLARLRDVQKALKAAKKNVADQRNIPYLEFCKQMDEMIESIDKTINDIDSQFKEIDGKRRAENLKKAKQLYDMTIAAAGYEEWIPFAEILATKANSKNTYEHVFGNIGTWGKSEDLETSGKKVVDVYQKIVKNIEAMIASVKALGSEHEAEGLEVLKTTHSSEKAIAEIRRLEKVDAEKKAAIAEARRQAELEAQRKIAEAERKANEEKARAEAEAQRKIEEERRKAEAEKQKAVEMAREEERNAAAREAEEAAKKARADAEKILGEKVSFIDADPVNDSANEEKFWVSFKACITATQAVELKEFFKSRNIEFGPI